MMGRLLFALECAARRMDDWMTKHRLVFSCLLALALCGVLALYNVSSGPLSNLNDIGGWANRALFIELSAVAHGCALMLCALVSRCGFFRTALRQVILTAGYYIMLLAINQKSFAFVEVMLPAIRTMQSEGFAAAVAMDTGLSAFALLVIRVLSAAPIYPMYMLKLMAMIAMMAIAVLMMRAAEKNGLGIRSEALLALCMILPQGFMNAACSALIDVTAVALLLGALSLAENGKKRSIAAALLLAVGCALSGICLYALPVIAWMWRGSRQRLCLLALVPAVMMLGGLPAVFGGAGIADVAASFLRVNLGLPAYASGAPGVFNLIPRALVEEIPQYAPLLRHMAQLDLVTYDQRFYTQAHFEIVMRGMAIAGLAAYLGACVLVWRSEKPALHRALTLALASLIICPGATSGAWLLADVLCLYAILAAPGLRLPACLVLFATMTSSSYPMTEEVMLPMVYAFALCLAALMMLLDVIPTEKGELKHE